MTYFFTYAAYGQDHAGGWTEVFAADMNQACAIFRIMHPDQFKGVLHCAGVYDLNTMPIRMLTEGNFGHHAWDRLSIKLEVFDHE